MPSLPCSAMNGPPSRQCLALCRACAEAHVHAPGALPDLLASLHARYDEGAALDLLIASYDPQASLFADTPVGVPMPRYPDPAGLAPGLP